MDTPDVSAVIESPSPAGPTPLRVRFCAAIPHLVTAGLLLAVFVSYISGDIRITQSVRDASGWLKYELLACVYMSVLPLGWVVVGIVRAALKRPAAKRLHDGSILLLVPFAWMAWSIAPSGSAGWGLLVFLGLAFARWAPHRHEAALLRDAVMGVAGSAKRAVRVWSFFTAAFLLSAFLILPLEPLLGLEMPSVDHGQYFVFLGMGMIYFGLNAVFELFDLMHRWFPSEKRLRNPFAPALETKPGMSP